MTWILSPSEYDAFTRQSTGGKAYALASLAKSGLNIPKTVCVTSEAYRAYVLETGLRERVMLELHRKAFGDMRWEEIWDCATRIRNLFLKTPMPSGMKEKIGAVIEARLGHGSVAVRSSAPDEDSGQSSFAGLHDSYLNVKGTDNILRHIQLVWASLWSDAALLYRQEIGLNLEKSAMAVVVQEMIAGDRSGVTFTKNPNKSSQGVIEAVHGLNEGLVDGSVEPDRWIINRSTGRIISHRPALRKEWITADTFGVGLASLPANLTTVPPVSEQEVLEVFQRALAAEALFQAPQDVEWTYRQDTLFLVQSRPITTGVHEGKGDNRSWYLSLHRSFENLKTLRTDIEGRLIPDMIRVAEELAGVDLAGLSHTDLAEEIQRRLDINHHWVSVYWETFIPFAHGVRLFGQYYNDLLRPDDPYEFIDLLTHTEMASLERNRQLEALAEQVRQDENLALQIEAGDFDRLDDGFVSRVESFIEQYGDLTCAVTGGTECMEDADPLFKILLEMASHPPLPEDRRKSGAAAALMEKLMNRVALDRREEVLAMLELARASYRLRDDDNIYLGRIEAKLLAAIHEARRRCVEYPAGEANDKGMMRLKEMLSELDRNPAATGAGTPEAATAYTLKPRQLTGQPAGPGIAKGKARVVRRHADLSDFQYGEILVCDAVDPNMTFVIPLAAAVVERRGGMLIHGAIIAREYGLPCVTGIPDATTLIETGAEMTVDGFLGIVTIGADPSIRSDSTV